MLIKVLIQGCDSSNVVLLPIYSNFILWNWWIYLIIKYSCLGEGQFGEVYNGKLIGNNENNNGLSKQALQHVAIKRLRHIENSFVQELYNEGERMLNLDHPYVIKIFGICKHETSVSLILELCPYGAMNRWLRLNK